MDCIFCRIIAGDLPAHKLAEDERTVAFLDINPATQGHSLIIPKKHCENIFDADPEDLAAIITMAQQVAHGLNKVLTPDGINIIQNNGTAAGQVVMHYHMHLIPRWNDDNAIVGWTHIDKDSVDFPGLAEQLSSAL